LGQKVQYVLEKRLAKRMMPVKGLVSPRDAAGYIQDRWLTPVVGHDRFTDADAIEIKTVCAAAYHAGIPLDQGYLWEIENKAQKEHNLKLAQQINQQAKLHKKLHCAQTAGFWISVRRCFGLDREIN
jgi:hypothetical protein